MRTLFALLLLVPSVVFASDGADFKRIGDTLFLNSGTVEYFYDRDDKVIKEIASVVKYYEKKYKVDLRFLTVELVDDMPGYCGLAWSGIKFIRLNRKCINRERATVSKVNLLIHHEVLHVVDWFLNGNKHHTCTWQKLMIENGFPADDGHFEEVCEK